MLVCWIAWLAVSVLEQFFLGITGTNLPSMCIGSHWIPLTPKPRHLQLKLQALEQTCAQAGGADMWDDLTFTAVPRS